MSDSAPYFNAFERLLALIDNHPRRAIIAIPTAMLVAVFALIIWQAPTLISLYESRTNREYERRILDEERERRLKSHAIEIDEWVRGRLLKLRLRSSSSRAVIRALVFDIDQSEQIVGIVDVFESMDIRTEQTGIRRRQLPLSEIRRTLDYMLASDVPRCIARNIEDYDDPGLIAFMNAGNLKASVACPLRTLDDRPIGLLAVSIRTPLEENPLVLPMTRDAALELGAILTDAASFKAVAQRKMVNNQ